MSHSDPWLVVVGASAGGFQALQDLVRQFHADFPAPVFIVNHMGPQTTGEALVHALDQWALTARHADHGQRFTAGNIYVARTDQHMMIDSDHIILSKGARENRARPAIDPLFRSAAVAHGTSVIGVILGGYLDDGTSGMMAIRRCGGICVAQDPDDTAYPDMPLSVIAHVGVDYCLPVSQMGAVLDDLVRHRPDPRKDPPEDLVIEARIAQRVLSDLPAVETLGDLVPFNCPECNGVLWQMHDKDILRYRCHTGHAFTAAALLALQTSKIEETLWIALRMFEERQNLLTTMNKTQGTGSSSMTGRIHDAQIHIDRIRTMLKASATKSQG